MTTRHDGGMRNVLGAMAWTVVVAMLLAPASAFGAEQVFKAGASASNITPELGSPLVGGWNSPEATHIHDELWARTLVLDDGSTKLVFTICDNLAVAREVFDDAAKRVHEKTGIPIENMLMASTHTHSGPPARPGNVLDPPEELSEYQQFLADRIVDGVRRALNDLEPARIGWGAGDVPSQVFNRRWHMSDESHTKNPFGGVDKVRMNPPRNHESLEKPAGPTDPEVAFLAVESVDGRPIALLANYSLHYVGAVGPGHVSADYFGVFSREIERLLEARGEEPPFTGILSNGTSGDINNLVFKGSRPPRERYEQMHIVASMVAAEVLKAYQEVQFQDWVELDARKAELTLDVRKPSPDVLEWARRIVDNPDEAPGYHSREEVYARRTLQQHESPDQVDVWVQALRVGDLGIGAIPFEVFAETGLKIKDESPFGRAFTISFGNGGYGYLPTPRHFELGGYETWLGTSKVAPDSAPRIETAILDMMKDMHGEAK